LLLIVSSRPRVDEGLQSLDDDRHVWPEIGFVLDAQRCHGRELNRINKQDVTIQSMECARAWQRRCG
jgi:hypothetical protein